MNRILAFTTIATIILTLSLGVILPNAGTVNATIPRTTEPVHYVKFWNGLNVNYPELTGKEPALFTVEYTQPNGVVVPQSCTLAAGDMCGPFNVPVDYDFVITASNLPADCTNRANTWPKDLSQGEAGETTFVGLTWGPGTGPDGQFQPADSCYLMTACNPPKC